MSESIALEDLELDISHLTTEDDLPVDNLPSEKQQRLLTEPLYSSGFKSKDTDVFLAAANVGIFYSTHQPPLVPDVFLSLGVQVAENWWDKKNRSYFTWEFGKPPDVVIEIVSNRKGEELGSKLRDYAQIGVKYYIVFDPSGQLSRIPLQVYQLQGMLYVVMETTWLEQVGLGVTLWEGSFEGKHDLWLRWCDRDGQAILTGSEKARRENQRAEQEYQRAEQEYRRAEQEHQRAEQERQRAEQESQRAEQERLRAERFAARLQALGLDPDRLDD
ncbi:Uma2 family endonuclease [Altericista sp. CCNU0014]|uniref:Uma2 family endonuclease n=1 Tax=Altericista sp. CCNU0014 TaxID=3082949 RepID=UPI00384CE66E